LAKNWRPVLDRPGEVLDTTIRRCAKVLLMIVKSLLAGALSVFLTAAVFAWEIDWKTVLNPDSQALETGLFFHSSVPNEVRKLIVDDLAWLATQNNLRNTDRLAKVLGITAQPLTGGHIAAWILARVAVIVDSTWCDERAQVVVSQSRPDRLTLFRIDRSTPSGS
jgi:hypothetical protein